MRRNVMILSILAAITGSFCGVAPAFAQDAPIATGKQAAGTARIDILSLTRTDGDTVTIRFMVKNVDGNSVSLTLGNTKLLDLVNRRLYGSSVYSNSCSTRPNVNAVCWIVFAAPPVGLKTINIQFQEDFGLITVPMTN